MKLNDITYKIRGAIFSVYNELGPGLLENIYEAALAKEFDIIGLRYQSEVPVKVMYKNADLGLGYRMDILVEDMVVIELKSVETILNVHLKQLSTYLKITGKTLGILVNFNTTDLEKNIKRIANGDISSL
jgi:GxxExxY protein